LETLLIALGTILGASYAIHLAASSFEEAANFLGRNMPPGVKGATLNAIASSLPEVFTTFFLLFYLGDTIGFASGLATCAGSAMFNMTVIPGLCILFTASVVKQRGETISPNKKLILRDGAFFVVAEAILLYVVGLNAISAVVSGLLMLGYGFYGATLIRQVRKFSPPHPQTPMEHDAEDEDERPARWWALLQLDTRNVLFPGRDWTSTTATVVLLAATLFLGIACDFLAKAVVDVARYFDISPFFSAVILAAAGTSIPDALLSIKDAQKGNYEDALSNAFGSNIFNIFVALGLPVFVYTLINGPLPLEAGVDMERVKTLCMSLIGVSIIAVSILAFPGKLTRRHGGALLGIYGIWALGTVLPLAFS